MNIDLAKIDFGKSKGSEPVPVTNLGSGTWDDPYTVEGVKAYIDTLTPGQASPDDVYVKGIVCSIVKSYEDTGSYGNSNFYISDTGDSTGSDFHCNRTKYFYNLKYNDVNASEKYDIQIGDKVVIYGKVRFYNNIYNNTVYETISNRSYLYLLNGWTLTPDGEVVISDPGNYDISWYDSVVIPDYRYRKGGPVGLEDIGWSDDDIRMFKDNVPIYLWESGSDLYTVSDNNKNLYGVINMQNLNNYASDPDLVWLPWIEIPSGVGFDYMYMFQGFENMRGLPNFFVHSEFSKNMSYMFESCFRLETIPALDTSSVKNMESMFSGCESLRVIPELDTSSVFNMASMFQDCIGLYSIPYMDTSRVENMSYMFDSCFRLETIPALDTSNVTNMESMFLGCESLRVIPELDTSNVTNMDYMFYGCVSLMEIQCIDFSSLVAAPDGMFTGIDNVTDLIVTGEINFDCSGATDFINVLTNLSYESVETILRAMYATSNSNQKEMVFDCTVEDPDSVLADLIVDCGTKGWTVTGLNLVYGY